MREIFEDYFQLLFWKLTLENRMLTWEQNFWFSNLVEVFWLLFHNLSLFLVYDFLLYMLTEIFNEGRSALSFEEKSLRTRLFMGLNISFSTFLSDVDDLRLLEIWMRRDAFLPNYHLILSAWIDSSNCRIPHLIFKMIWRPATRIELKQEEDMAEYEEFLKEK